MEQLNTVEKSKLINKNKKCKQYDEIYEKLKNYHKDELKPVKQYFIDTYDEDMIPKLSANKYNDNSLDYILNKKINKKYKNVFERLTDTNFYTGIHKERFDELGNGRGLAGNEDLFIYDGWTETATRTHEVYSTVIKKNKTPIVTPGTLGIQKYGIQIATPKYIWLFRNGDKYHNGEPFLVKSHINTLNALLYEITKVISPIIGPVRKIYDQNFKVVKNIEHLVDGAKYLCTSGEPPAPLDKLEIFMSKWIIRY